MSILPPSIAFPCPTNDRGFAGVVPSVGASQRASLGRGLAFVLLLTASALACVYAPLALHEADGLASAPAVASR